MAGRPGETGKAGGDFSGAPTLGAPLTGEGTIVGTFQYMAPEQLEGRHVDSRTDIFAFGSVLYEMVTGRRAFEGRSQASLIGAILKDDPPPIASLQPLAPPTLDRVVKKCLAKDPDYRWQSARDMLDELKWVAESASQVSSHLWRGSERYSVRHRASSAITTEACALRANSRRLVSVDDRWTYRSHVPFGASLPTRMCIAARSSRLRT